VTREDLEEIKAAVEMEDGTHHGSLLSRAIGSVIKIQTYPAHDAKASTDLQLFPMVVTEETFEAFRNCFTQGLSLAQQGKSCLQLLTSIPLLNQHHPRLAMMKCNTSSGIRLNPSVAVAVPSIPPVASPPPRVTITTSDIHGGVESTRLAHIPIVAEDSSIGEDERCISSLAVESMSHSNHQVTMNVKGIFAFLDDEDSTPTQVSDDEWHVGT
jgi:hypothetical protein